MRYVYARFKGYIGFYNGMGLEELVIDFSKANHKICIISGKNGSGKSTLLNALHLLPDSSSSYMPNTTAEKELHVMDNGNMYMINIISAITSTGNRSTTKAYINKNGIELNPNGNISSYKDILYSEFELDPNYVSLSKLSMEDKGLVTKTPGERKKFIAKSLASLDAYNAMNKIFVKKSNIFKSYINNISSKIRSIGDEQQLYSTLNSIENRIKDLEAKKKCCEADIAEANSFIKIVDPDGSMQGRYSEIYNTIKSCNEKIEVIDNGLEKALSEYNIEYNNLEVERERLSMNTTQLQSRVELDTERLRDIIQRKDDDAHMISIKQQKIENIKNEFDVDNLKKAVYSLRNIIKSQESIFSRSGFTNIVVSRDEYNYIFSTLRNIKHRIILFRDRAIDVIEKACSTFVNGTVHEVERDVNELESIRNNNERLINDSRLEIKIQKNNIDMMKILDSRPDDCKIDTCPLINTAVEISKANPLKRIEELNCIIDKASRELDSISSPIEFGREVLVAYDELVHLVSDINTYDFLDKIDIGYIVRNTDELVNRIVRGDTFNEIEDSDSYIERAEEIENYTSNKELLIKLEADLKIVENKTSLIDELQAEASKLIEDVDKLEKEVATMQKGIDFNMDIINTNLSRLNIIDRMIELKKEKERLLSIKESSLEEYRSIKSNLEKLKVYADTYEMAIHTKDSIEQELIPLTQQKTSIDHSLISLVECRNEFNRYQEKYNVVNKLKKYSSPTDEGIQTLFINVYMSETLSLANDLLSLLFGGEYRLLQYVINEDEFRLPFIGTGIAVDDISSGSSSQVSMMGLIVNFVLMFQGSTKYNIVGCDELDEALDTYNRLQYIQVLYRIIDILNIDQCFIISHSPDIDRSNMDVIQLAEYNPTDCYGDGNIIFNYYERRLR